METAPHPFSIRSIYLRSGVAELSPDMDPLLPGIALFAAHRIANQEISIGEGDFVNEQNEKLRIRTLTVLTSFDFKYLKSPELPDLPPDKDPEFHASIKALISAEYFINQSANPTDDVIQKWAQQNSVLHTWPYWREYCQSSLLRLNMPAVWLPLLSFADSDAKTETFTPVKSDAGVAIESATQNGR